MSSSASDTETLFEGKVHVVAPIKSPNFQSRLGLSGC